MGKAFTILNQKIQISSQMDRYNSLKLKFEKLAHQYSDSFVQVYKNENSSLDDVSKKAFQQGFQFIYEAIEIALEELVTKYKIYTLDEDTFFREYVIDYFTWEEDFNKINDQYLEIVMDSEQLDKYRQSRRESRGRVVGGGFGVSGALQGMATAGAMNIASGAAHMMFNGVAKTFTAIGNSSKKSAIFKNPETLKTLESGVYSNISNLSLAIIDAVEELIDEEIFDYITVDEAKEAELIYTNLSKGRVPEEDIAKLIFDIFTRNPYQLKYYIYTMEKYGDQNGELSRMAKYFGIDLDAYKKGQLKKQLIDIEALKSVKDIDKFLTKIQLKAKSLGLANIDEITNIYYVHREKLDVLERTVDGIIFEQHKDVEIAKEELARVKDIYSSSKPLKEAEAIQTLETLQTQNWQTAISDKYVAELQKIITKHDLEYRTVDGIEYETREEAKSIRSSQREIEKLKKLSDLTTIEGIEQALQSAETIVLPNETVRATYISYLQQLKVTLDQALRTFKGVQYDTIELAKTAEEVYLAKVQAEKESIHTIITGDISKKQLKKQLEALSPSQFETHEALEELNTVKKEYLNTKAVSKEDVKKQSGKKSKGKSIVKFILASVATLFIAIIGLALIGANADSEQEQENVIEQSAISQQSVLVEESSVVSAVEEIVTTEESVQPVMTTPISVNSLDSVPFIGSNNTVESARQQIENLVYYYLQAYVQGDISSLEYYIYSESDFYSEQLQYMESLRNRNIMLDLIDYSVLNINQVSDEAFSVTVEEFYTIDNPSSGFKSTSQTSNYSVELIYGEFYITSLEL
ncbi:MAG: hypothetical protein UHX00_06200 [Caryophanon sp.]|nr:hypothetical protein [Caryophanon sp.]